MADPRAIGRFDLTAAQLRVLGCLLEKQHTTPDVYPLSLNSLRLACNQATNRDPVVDYGEQEIRDALHRLERHGLSRLASGAGSRAPKYRHLLAEALPMEEAEQAVLCVLMLRGPQTPGELKQRADRIHPFAELEKVTETLERMIERGLVLRLERRPGQKEERYSHLLAAEEEDLQHTWPGAQSDPPAAHQLNGTAAPDLAARVAELERRVATLEGTPALAGDDRGGEA